MSYANIRVLTLQRVVEGGASYCKKTRCPYLLGVLVLGRAVVIASGNRRCCFFSTHAAVIHMLWYHHCRTHNIVLDSSCYIQLIAPQLRALLTNCVCFAPFCCPDFLQHFAYISNPSECAFVCCMLDMKPELTKCCRNGLTNHRQVAMYKINSFLFYGSLAGVWKDQSVAVKIVTHTRAEEPLISRELSLAQQLEHPHLVKTLHFARMTLKRPETGSPVSFNCRAEAPHGHKHTCRHNRGCYLLLHT